MENGHKYIAYECVWDGNSSTPFCRECSEPWTSQNLRLQAVVTDHVKIGPVTEIEVFKSAGIWVTEVQVPSQQLGNSKSWVRISRGIEHYARHFIPTVVDHKNLEAAPPQQ